MRTPVEIHPWDILLFKFIASQHALNCIRRRSKNYPEMEMSYWFATVPLLIFYRNEEWS